MTALSIVLPAHNEARNLPPLLERCRLLLDRSGPGEIIVVDDGSDDGSGDVARSSGADQVLRHDRARGYGAALRAGAAVARETWVLLIDGDGQFDPLDARLLLRLRDQATVILGWRAPRRDAWPRTALGWTWHKLAGPLLDLRVRDVNCGMKLVRRDVLERLDLRSDGAFFSAELIDGARRLGAAVRQCPVPHHPRLHGRATGADPRVASRALVDLAAHLWRRRR